MNYRALGLGFAVLALIWGVAFFAVQMTEISAAGNTAVGASYFTAMITCAGGVIYTINKWLDA